jgi:hypothetical protein
MKAVQTAQEDAENYYVLGFYPAETDLDNSGHQLTLEVSKRASRRPDLTMRYRQIYLATKSGSLDDKRPRSLSEYSSTSRVQTEQKRYIMFNAKGLPNLSTGARVTVAAKPARMAS